jgi:glycerol uptake facilitator-like aquaporin
MGFVIAQLLGACAATLVVGWLAPAKIISENEV